MHSELLDIFDETMTLIGTASRSETHRQGLWHQTFQCWIAARRPNGISLLLQKRHPGKDTFPELYDITSAGHLLAGETAEDGVRELEEELGIAAAFDELVPIGVIPVQLRYQSLIDREFCHVFLYACSLPLDRYKLQADEVTGIVEVDVDAAAKLFAKETLTVEAVGLETGDDGSLQPVRRQLEASDFVPHGDDYYKRVLDAVIRHFA